MRYKNRATDSTVFTFSDSVVDDVIINIKAVCSKNADGRREAVVESAALNVWLFFCHLSPQKETPNRFNRYFLLIKQQKQQFCLNKLLLQDIKNHICSC